MALGQTEKSSTFLYFPAPKASSSHSLGETSPPGSVCSFDAGSDVGLSLVGSMVRRKWRELIFGTCSLTSEKRMRASGGDHELRGCDRDRRGRVRAPRHTQCPYPCSLASTSTVCVPLCSILPSKHRIHLLEAQQLLDRAFPMQTPALAGQHVWYWAIQPRGVQAQLAGAAWEVLLCSTHGGTGI